MRELGFGAGMGLPNIRRNTDDLVVSSDVGCGTTVVMTVHVS
jgi:anti-sigma regulatory factor (Ser/Thr protein kinase)